MKGGGKGSAVVRPSPRLGEEEPGGESIAKERLVRFNETRMWGKGKRGDRNAEWDTNTHRHADALCANMTADIAEREREDVCDARRTCGCANADA